MECEPLTAASAPLDSPRQPRAGERFTVKLGSAAGTRIRITVTGTRRVGSIPDRYGEAGSFTAPDGFVAVHYRLHNLGPRAVEPAAHVNRQFGVEDARSPAALSVDGVKGCAAAPPSYAKKVDRSNPEDDLKPGERARTVALYAVPASTARMAWTAPLLDVRVPLGGV